MGSPKHNEEVNHTRKECFLDWWEVWRITGPSNIWRSQLMKSSETTDCSDFFKGPNPPMPRFPHETVTFLVRLAETSIFLVEYVQSLRISDDLWLLTPPPPSSKNIQTKQYSSRSLSKATCSPTGLHRDKGLGFKELNSRNWSQHINFEIKNDSFMMFYG